MEENVNEVLGVQETKENETVVEYADTYSHEKTLKTIATIVLIVGIIATLICLFTITSTTNVNRWGDTEKEFSMMGLLISILVGISSVTTWAILNVLSNISINLYKIKDSLKAK